jgi:hypothetical protein
MKPLPIFYLLFSFLLLADEPISRLDKRDALPDPAAIRFVPPPPPKEVPPLDVRGSTTADFGTHRVTILRAEPSTLPDIPEPPPVERAAPRVASDAEPNYLISITGQTYDGRVSQIQVWNPISRTRYSAWCGWDVSLLAPFQRIELDGKPRSLALFVSNIDTTKRPGHVPRLRLPEMRGIVPGAILVPDNDEFTVELLNELHSNYINHLPRLVAIRAASEQYTKDAAAWHAANPPQPQDHTIWLKPHRGSRYLKDETVADEEGGR